MSAADPLWGQDAKDEWMRRKTCDKCIPSILIKGTAIEAVAGPVTTGRCRSARACRQCKRDYENSRWLLRQTQKMVKR